jgi:hypothetical protein
MPDTMNGTTQETTEREELYREVTERFWILRLITKVHRDAITVELAPFQRSPRHIASTEIADVSVATYSSGTYGGWHWGLRRSAGGNTVYRLRGNRGVELTLRDGTRIFIGSQTPSELEAAIGQAVESA